MRGNVKIGESFTFDLRGLNNTDKPFEMIWVSPDTFLMGSSEDEKGRRPFDENLFSSTITDGFWLSKYPVTIAHWYSGLGLTSEMSNLEMVSRDVPKGVSRYEALMFCWELNRLVFYQAMKFDEIFSKGYRFILPTETQWEYACRAGTSTAFYNGNRYETLQDIAWYWKNSSGNIQAVGQKIPNNWGFHDMLGTISEWCLDVYTDYPTKPVTNWIGNSNEPDPHYSVRGGSYNETAEYARCASRGYQIPLTLSNSYGFRLCLSNIEYQYKF